MYTAAGVPIWGITTTNEPINGILALATFNSLGWTMREMVTDCAAKFAFLCKTHRYPYCPLICIRVNTIRIQDSISVTSMYS